MQTRSSTYKFRKVSAVGWGSLGIGFIGALITFRFPMMVHILHVLTTIIHEFGHSVCDWFFGYPSVPSFDLVYGGGYALKQNRETFIIVCVYAALIIVYLKFLRKMLPLYILPIILCVYTVCAFTRIHDIIILFMGHGTELIFATIFLYRAISNYAVKIPIERPMYAWLGFYIQMYDIRFAYKLITDASEKLQYEQAKGGGHTMDFSRIAENYLHVDLHVVVALFMVWCLLPIFIAYIVYICKPYMLQYMKTIKKEQSV